MLAKAFVPGIQGVGDMTQYIGEYDDDDDDDEMMLDLDDDYLDDEFVNGVGKGETDSSVDVTDLISGVTGDDTISEEELGL